MPELPEVQIIVNILKSKLIGAKIIKTKVFYAPVIKNFEAFSQIEEKTILDIQRKGKFLLFFLTQKLVIIGHLRLEGKLFLKPASNPHEATEHFVLFFDNDLSLRYYDFRKFGRFEVQNQKDFLTKTTLNQLASDPFEIDFMTFYQKVVKSKTALKKVLLNQKIISGLGNIYVNEVLFLAKLHPETKACDLNPSQVQNILEIAKKVLKKAIFFGGSSISTFEPEEGTKGSFQNHLLVHGKQKIPCTVCMTNIIKIKVGGRGTYLCPSCQPIK
ncbi:Formamidopyrimidine-DNA glycosylase [Candidatus Phytoplasma australiense]|uniref:Formamidopyrimidine-DNA glycosylase n=2 Tax=Phytoplasma australiense TaxID=59748 RepID=B1VB34_PHYAS|nr:DNA-formamidopyrimidine glycosylase [Candidatus Phytoplasma australiense]AGL90974.1 Formamidopyrimidine-DNA glycosylase [Strawberry lethal yellows phytoplasma (CPA) str. NZSb11]CAM12157.1 Formamidopyrimidine-DNA glycosylase [Candidatus Phytoplasma australiense]